MRFPLVTAAIFTLALCASSVALAQAPAPVPAPAEAAFSPAPATAETAPIARLREQARHQYAAGDRDGLTATVAALRVLDPESRDAALYDSLLRRGTRTTPLYLGASAPSAPAAAAPGTSATAAAGAPPPKPIAPGIPSALPAVTNAPPPAASPSPASVPPLAHIRTVTTSVRAPGWWTVRALLGVLVVAAIGLFLALGRVFRRRTAVASAGEAARHLGRGAGQPVQPPPPSDSSPSMGVVSLMTKFGKAAENPEDEFLSGQRPFSESSPVMPLVENKPRRPEEPLFPNDRAEPPADSGPINLMAPGDSPAPPPRRSRPEQPPEPTPYVLDAPKAPSPPPAPPAEAPAVPQQRPVARPAAPVFPAAAQAQAEAPERPAHPAPGKARIRRKDTRLVESDDATLAPFQVPDAADLDATLFHSDDDTRDVVLPHLARGAEPFASDDETKTSFPQPPPEARKSNQDEDTQEIPKPKGGRK
jgi:hypothetical protein